MARKPVQRNKPQPGMIRYINESRYKVGGVEFTRMKEFDIEGAKDLSSNYMEFNSLAELREYQRQQKPR